MRGHGGGVTLLMLVTGILVILAAILPQADNTLFFGRYIINWLMPGRDDAMSWNNYHRLDSIYSYMDSMSSRFPDKVKVHVIGRTHEGREIRVVRIGKRNRRKRQSRSKPAIFIEGGIHAREWISPATVTYVMNELITNPQHGSLLNMFDFFILPVTNPDGYEYSHTVDRLWRKNRNPNPSTFGLCPGVDLNRNFGYKWGHEVNIFDPRPASPIPCLDTFHGGQAFSEPETRAVRDFVMSKRHRLQGYLAFHSFGNKILYPWGYTNNPTNDVEELRSFADVAKSAISTSFAQSRSFNWLFSEDQIARYDVAQVSHRANNPEKKPSQSSNTVRNSLRRIFFGDVDDTAAQTEAEYEYGQPQNIIYRVTGGSDDWARGGAGIKYVLLFELPGGVYGFMLPPRFIRPVASSIMSSVDAMARHINSNTRGK